jgi:formylglycine-generating enzyme required for sulfatase activity
MVMKHLSVVALLLISAALAAPSAPTAAAQLDETRTIQSGLAEVRGGRFHSILPTGTKRQDVTVAPYQMDHVPVTNARFLEFVRANPQWRRDRVARLFADEQYLRHWNGPVTLGRDADPQRPVTSVSWFSARAYCEAQGQRLPDWYEWEYAAAADEKQADARGNAVWRQQILDWYSRPSGGVLARVGASPANVYGIRDLHGLVWEWVEDFNALMVSGDSREQGDPDKLKFCGAGALALESRDDYAIAMRLAMLSSLQARDTTANLGFRCATRNVAPSSRAVTRSWPADSLYNLDIALETSQRRQTAVADTTARARIVTMFYASCPALCPLTIDTLQHIDSALTATESAHLEVVLVTIDPEQDSAESLDEVARAHHVDPKRWVLARASAPDTRKLASALGVQYRRLDDGSFDHSGTLILLDGEGRVLARSSRMGVPDPQFVSKVRAALSNP